MNVIAVDTGKQTLVSVAPHRIRLADPQAAAEMTVAFRVAAGGNISAILVGSAPDAAAGGAAIVVVPADELMHQYLVRVPAAEITPATNRLIVTILPNAAAATAKAEYSYPLTTPTTLLARFEQHLAKLQAAAGANALLRAHLDSTRRVVQDAYNRLPVEVAAHPERAAEFLDILERIEAKLPVERYDWSAHVACAMPLVFAFVSDADRTLQFYSLQLPYGYEEGKTYPLTVYLHGAGDQNPLDGLSTTFDNSHQDTLFRTEPIDPAKVPPSHRGFVLAPWARGNSAYRAYGEADVYQSLQLVTTRFKIDPDRVYLTGFSMGCAGTMGIAARHPDLFAGINLASGFGPWSETSLSYLAENLRGLPIAIWAGELDPMSDGARAFDKLLTDKQIAHRFEILPRTPHTYPYDEFQKNVGYLMQFTRQRPTTFSFVADMANHTGRNGVYMSVPQFPTGGPWPQFACKIEGQTVTLTSQNTPGLTVDLAELGMSGDVKVLWNGQEAYAGPTKVLALGSEAPRRPRR